MEKEDISEIKFLIFINKNQELRLKSFHDSKSALERKYGIDLKNKDQMVIKHEPGVDLKKKIKKILEMKSNYADLIHRFNKKIGAKNIQKIFKIKA